MVSHEAPAGSLIKSNTVVTMSNGKGSATVTLNSSDHVVSATTTNFNAVGKANGGSGGQGTSASTVQMPSAKTNLDQADGPSADISDDARTRMQNEVRFNKKAGGELALKQLTAMCSTNTCDAKTGTPAGFSATKFEFDSKHFYQNENPKGHFFTGGSEDPQTGAIRLYDGGIALQLKGTGPEVVAEIMLHEYRHTLEINRQIRDTYFSDVAAGLRLPAKDYKQYPWEIDAFDWSNKVMRYETPRK